MHPPPSAGSRPSLRALLARRTPTEHTAHTNALGPKGPQLATAAVCVLTGLLLVISAGQAHTLDEDPRPSRGELADLYLAERTKLEQANLKAGQLRAQVQEQAQRVSQQSGQQSSAEQQQRLQYLRQVAGLEPAQGAGLSVTLNDAPAGSYEKLGADGNPDDFVVHQQDVQAVVNALWAGGAQAMMLQDQRVISTSAVRCVGTVLLLQNRSYPPPYTVTVIGPVAQMQQALEQSTAVTLYREYADRLGLEYTVSPKEHITMPGYEGSTGIDLAHVAAAG